MDSLFSIILILAEEGGAKGPSFFSSIFPFIAIAIVLYMFMVAKPEQAERAKKEDLLKNLKKNDLVLTRFGMYGTVALANPESDDVVLKLEDNAKIRVLKSTIQGVIVPPSQSDEAGKK